MSDVTPAGLSWFWISIAATLPAIGGVLVALPFWRTRQMTFGSIVGAALIFGSGVGFILRDYVEVDRVVQQCLDMGTTCFPEPSAFTRFAIYAFIALGQVFVLFTVSIKVEERMRRRDYSPEWR